MHDDAMLPNESTDPWVGRNRFVRTVFELISRVDRLDRQIVDEWQCVPWNLVLQNERCISLKYLR